MAAKKQAAPKGESNEAAKKEAKKKSGSVLSGLDQQVHEVAGEVEKAVKGVGGDIARGLAQKALDKINEAVDLLAKAEREDS